MTTMTNQETASDADARGGSMPSTDIERSATANSDLVTSEGKTSISDAVVRKIAGIATREISGVHNLGTGGTRTLGALRERIPGSNGPNIGQGVGVEVGERQAAIDLDVVVEYGVSIVDLAAAIRRNVISSLE